ncbi:MAG: hypothetical protein CSYNP_04385 [Syntrophus sp. SKADARSKE-3]|nr:hypothetical protein [Syntrophus sp. SKADARSKE-3]
MPEMENICGDVIFIDLKRLAEIVHCPGNIGQNDEIETAPPDQFLGSVTEKTFHGRTHIRDDSLLIRYEKDIGAVLDDDTEKLFTPAQRGDDLPEAGFRFLKFGILLAQMGQFFRRIQHARGIRFFFDLNISFSYPFETLIEKSCQVECETIII